MPPWPAAYCACRGTAIAENTESAQGLAQRLLKIRLQVRHGLQADAHYTWSKTRDMGTHSNGGGQTMNNYDIWADYGPAAWDVPHRFVASYIYDVPFL